MDRASIIRQLRERGWRIDDAPDTPFRLPEALVSRYPRLPETLTSFLSGLRECTDAKETRWFLCWPDYQGVSSSQFRWNEWEELSLQAARDSRDERWEASVRAFWDLHFPFMLSVADGYSYFAIRVAPSEFGRVVFGREPEFEEVNIVADSFDRFIQEMVDDTFPMR